MTVTLSVRRIALVLAAAVAVLAAFLLGSDRSAGAAPPGTQVPAAAQAAVTSASTGAAGATGITVSGMGTVSGTPDTLVVSFSVSVDGASVSTAFGNANSVMAGVQKSLRAHGAAAKDLQTSNVSIQPHYSNKGNPDGYTVSESLTATLHDIGKAGDQISAAVASGGNRVRVDGVSLDLRDSGPLLSKARDDAFADAKAKAEQYAKDAGRSLGPVVSVSEVVQNNQPVAYRGLATQEFAAAAPVPISAGSTDVGVQVTVTFGLG